MADYGHDLTFGTVITPSSQQPHDVVALAQITERAGLDLATFQDHPYQPAFLDTWTLLSWVAAETKTLRVSGTCSTSRFAHPLSSPGPRRASICYPAAGTRWLSVPAPSGTPSRRSGAPGAHRRKRCRPSARPSTSFIACGTPRRAVASDSPVSTTG